MTINKEQRTIYSKMKRFWIDYSTSIGIYAENKEDALKRFWGGDYEEFGNAEIQVDAVEEEED